MNVSERIRLARKEKGLTQKQLGELCNIAEPTIRRYELDKLHPKIETIKKIANALDVDLPFLLGRTSIMNFGDLLKSIRKEEGLTISDLSALIGDDEVAILCYEKNMYLPKVDVLIRYCKTLKNAEHEITEYFFDKQNEDWSSVNRSYKNDFINELKKVQNSVVEKENKSDIIDPVHNTLINSWDNASDKDRKAVSYILGFEYTERVENKEVE